MKKKATANNGVGYRADMEAVAVNSAHVHDAEGLRLKKGRGGHRFCMMGLIIATWVIYISTYVIGSVIGAGALARRNRTNGTIIGVARKFYTEIKPQVWTFIVCWSAIYGWIILQILYTLTTLFRRGLDGAFLYVSPPLLPPLFFVANCVNSVLSTIWNATITREQLIVSECLLAGMAACIYVAVVSVVYQTEKDAARMTAAGCGKDVWVVRFLVHNGTSFYAAWLTIATILSLATVLTYRANVDQAIASTISLVIYGVAVVSYFILDNFVLNKYTHYIIAPYITAMLAFAGSMDKNWNPTNPNSISTAALFGLSCVGFLVKLITIIFKSKFKKNRVWEVGTSKVPQ